MALSEWFGVATAQAATAAHSAAAHHPQSVMAGLTSSLPLMLGFGAIFYFMIIRPQNKRQKEQRNLIEALVAGDEVLTAGGIVAKIASMNEEFVILSTNSGSSMTLQKSSISSVLPKGTLDSVQKAAQASDKKS